MPFGRPLTIENMVSTHRLIIEIIKLRLRWYLFYTAGLIRHHWQWLVIATLMLPMGMRLTDVIDLLAWPVVAIVDPGITWESRLVILILFQVIAVLWMFPQRCQIGGSAFSLYLKSLPLGSATRVMADVSVLLLASSLALLPFATGIALAGKTPLLSSQFTVLYLIECTLLLTLTQLLVLHQRWWLLTATLGVVALLATSITLEGTWASWLALAGATVGLFCSYYAAGCQGKSASSSISSANSDYTGTNSQFPKALRNGNKLFFIMLMARLLWHEKASIAPRLFGIFAISSFVVFLALQFEFDSRTDKLVVFAATITTALLSGIYPVAKRSRVLGIGYMKSMPLRRYFWWRLDTLTLVIISLLPFAKYAVVLFIAPSSSLIDVGLILGIQYIGLIAMGRILVARTPHKVVLVMCLCLAILWLTLLLI